jgi:Bacterial protein of unknown function (DUF899)
MEKPRVVSRDEWLAARLELLEAEKELTRRSDELARRRQELPWVRIDKEYRFETDEGRASLTDLFRGRSTAVMVAGAGSTEGILAVCIGKFRRFFRANRLENKGEIRWQQAKRETRSIRKGISR